LFPGIASLFLLCWDAAAMPVQLPSGEDEAAWGAALEEARKLVPELEFGLGGGTQGILMELQESGWAVHILTETGRCEPLLAEPPRSAESRSELLVAAADLVAQRACTRVEPSPVATVPVPERQRRSWLRLQAAADLRPASQGALDGRLAVARPLGSALRAGIEAGWTSPRLVVDDIGRMASADLGLAAWWLPGERAVTPLLGLSLGAALRWFSHDGSPFHADWTPIAASELGAALAVEGGWELSLAMRPGIDLAGFKIRRGQRTMEPGQAWLRIGLALGRGPPRDSGKSSAP